MTFDLLRRDRLANEISKWYQMTNEAVWAVQIVIWHDMCKWLSGQGSIWSCLKTVSEKNNTNTWSAISNIINNSSE